VTDRNEDSLLLNWTPSSSPGVTGYETFVDGIDYGSVYSPAAPPETVSLHCGRTYTISVVAFDGSGNKSAAATTTGTTWACADLAIVSNTATVSQAKVGQDVTFTIVATNNSPDPAELFVQTVQTSDGLSPVSTTCEGVSADGSFCEYGSVAPGQTVTETLVARVLSTGSQSASDVACVTTPDPTNETDPNPSNNCRTGTVEVVPTSDPPPPPSSPPADTTAPRIIGTPRIASALTEANGGWTNNPTSYSYQWQRCDSAGGNCTAIAAATGQIYTPTQADAGDTIRVLEWATNASGVGGPASSTATAAVAAPQTVSPKPPSMPQTTSPPGGPPPITASAAQIRSLLIKQLAPSGKAGGILGLLRARGYTAWFNAPGGGRLVIAWYYVPTRARVSRVTRKPVLVAAGRASFSKAGVVKVRIELTAIGTRVLKAAKRVKLTASAIYTPTGSSPVTATRVFTLRRR
jgi:uncharacterized repeat protein (TIGR01451 family)